MSELSDLIDRQVTAYRDHDLERFLSFYADDVTITDFDGTVQVQGLAGMRERYGQLFAAHPDLTIDIAQRIETGDFVIDEEVLANLAASGTEDQIRAVVIYKVTGGKISQVKMVR